MRARVSMPLKSPASTGVKSLNFRALSILKKKTAVSLSLQKQVKQGEFFFKFILK